MKYKMKNGELKVGSICYREVSYDDYNLILNSPDRKQMPFTESKFLSRIMCIIGNGYVNLCSMQRCTCVNNNIVVKEDMVLFRY